MKKILNHLSTDWYKYLLELIVITGGVFGAFALNNWNETLKEQKTELKFYREMVSDLKYNLVEIRGVDDGLRQNLYAISQIDHYLQSNKPIDDSLKYHFAMFTSLGIVNIANSAYQFMQSTGLDFVRNDSIRVDITEMYERQFYNVRYRNDKQQERIDQKIEPFMAKHFTLSEQDGLFDVDNNIITILNEPVDYDKLRSDFEFRNLYMGLKSWIQVRRFWLEETITDCEELILSVEGEIRSMEK